MYREVFQKNNISMVTLYPLYYLLNCSLFGRLGFGKVKKFGRKLDNRLAPVYYYFDGIISSVKKNNLKIIVAKKMDWEN